MSDMTQGTQDPDLMDINSGPRDELYWWYRAFEASLALESREQTELWQNRIYTAPPITRKVLKERLQQLRSHQTNPELFQQDRLDKLPELPRAIFSSESGRFALEKVPGLSPRNGEEAESAGVVSSMLDVCWRIHPPTSGGAEGQQDCCGGPKGNES